MHEVCVTKEGGSNDCRVISAADDFADGKSAVDDSDWFASAARQLLPHKAGTALHFTTGFDERICQRYAAGHVKPPAYFLRALLRSEQGATWLNILMAGCKAAWWREYQSLAARLARLERMRGEIERALSAP